ncbi:MAG: tRNA (adenosine(37)-N6)-threonylcarbamoyltransferase complex dimerization subunit type 1 TsaB [Corynebacterium sp.]|nr:tRNA (adenosine(37)-N6)-threonylcarbamoyltransferase complex dimerization subunit type 1 TsaB [Corynebacterium sp.]
MLILVIDTATPDLCVGLVRIREVTSGVLAPDTASTIAQEILVQCKHHNETLIPTVQALLREAGVTMSEIGAIIVGTGPGPFTGLRVGMATAAALGHALGLPVYGVPTHEAMGLQLPQPALVITDARRREIYYTVTGDVTTTGADVIAPADLPVPSGVAAYTAPEQFELPQLAEIPRVPVDFRASDWVHLVDFAKDPAPLVPLYLRRPDAKEPAPVHFEYALGEQP